MALTTRNSNSRQCIRGGMLMGLVAVMVTGCAGAPYPTREQIKQSDAGPYPKKYERAVNEYLSSVLKDPSSLRNLSITKPEKTAHQASVFMGGKLTYQYRSCVRYNAKNSYGGYVGMKAYTFYISHNSVFDVTTDCGW